MIGTSELIRVLLGHEVEILQPGWRGLFLRVPRAVPCHTPHPLAVLGLQYLLKVSSKWSRVRLVARVNWDKLVILERSGGGGRLKCLALVSFARPCRLPFVVMKDLTVLPLKMPWTNRSSAISCAK